MTACFLIPSYLLQLMQDFEVIKKILRNNLRVTSLLLFAAFFSSTFAVHSAYALTPGCGIFDISPDCDLSGWYSLIIGDVVIGILLSILFHRLASRNQRTLEAIIDKEEKLRLQRRDYAVHQLKGLLNTLLFTIGGIHRTNEVYNKNIETESKIEKRRFLKNEVLSEIRSEESYLDRIVQSIRNNMISANDVLDPKVVLQIDGLVTFVGELSTKEDKDGKMYLPKFQISKTKINFLIEFLQTYSVETHSFNEKRTNSEKQTQKSFNSKE